MMHARWINGNLAYWDTHQCRIIDAFGPTVCKVLEDFNHNVTSAADTPTGWTVTLTEDGGGESTIAATDGVGGKLLITTDGNEHDGISMQHLPEVFKLATSKPCYFGVKLQSNDATQSKWMVGLCITDTEMLGGVSDGAYFEKLDGVTDINFVLEKNATETTSGSAVGTFADNTDVTLEFYWDGAAMHHFVNGVEKTALAVTNLPDDEELAMSLEFETGEGNAATMTVDWMRCVQFN